MLLGKHPISTIVDRLQETNINEAVKYKDNASERATLLESVRDIITENAMAAFGESVIGSYLTAEDVKNGSIVTENSMGHMLSLNESTLDISFLTTSIATIIRQPMEASIHRLYKTEAVTTPNISLERAAITLKRGDQVRKLHEAFTDNSFVSEMYDVLQIGLDGIAPTRSAVDLLAGQDRNRHKVDKSAKITGIVYEVAGTPVAAENIRLVPGQNTYFDNKNHVAKAVFEVKVAVDDVRLVSVDATIDFHKGLLIAVNADENVTLVKFHFELSHDEHTSAVVLGAENSYSTLMIPTAPHFEVAPTLEQSFDLQHGESHMKGVNYIQAMTEHLVDASARREDFVLFNKLEFEGEGTYDFAANASFAIGSSVDWIRYELLPFIDQACTLLKMKYHTKDVIFRVGVSPAVLRYIDSGVGVVAGEQDGASLLNYSVTIKSAANTIVLVSSERFDNEIHINMQQVTGKKNIFMAHQYYKYQVILTNELQSSENHAKRATVFSERNLATVFDPAAVQILVENLPHKKTTGNFLKI
jgi:hypothetical protein